MKRNLLVVGLTLVLVAVACSGDRGADESGSGGLTCNDT